MKKRKLEELNVIDDFLFQEMIARDEAGKVFCRILLKTILGKTIRGIKIVPQKSILGTGVNGHGIKIDAYIETIEKNSADVKMQPTIYDIEPNKYTTGSEPKRTRYYHSLIDARILKSGVDYGELKDVVIIMILPYDPFGKNRMVYTVKRQCVEAPEIDYDDGTTTIYLYTKGTEGNPGQKLQDMLHYLENSIQENVKNEDLAKIHQLVTEVKQDEEVGISYMKSWELEKCAREEGRLEELVLLVCKKIKKNCSAAEIADILEEDKNTIQKIYDIAVGCAPEYNLEEIMKQLSEK